MDEKYINEILKDYKFQYEGMTSEERDLCLKYLGLTNELKKSEILKSSLYKKDGKYNLNGVAYIKCDTDEFDNIIFESEIIVKKEVISIFSIITHLYGKNINSPLTKEIETCDKFSKKNNKLIQETYYFNPNNKIETEYNVPKDFDIFYELSKSKQR